MIGAALRSVAQKGAELARHLAEETSSLGQLTSFKFQRDYTLGPQTGTVGAYGLWRVFAGTARSRTAIVRDVSIWVLDKRELASRGEGSALQVSYNSSSSSSAAQQHQRWEPVLEQQRQGCALMTRLKHPGVVRVVVPLEENAAYMVLVTEAVRGCLMGQLQAQAAQPSTHGIEMDPSDPPPYNPVHSTPPYHSQHHSQHSNLRRAGAAGAVSAGALDGERAAAAGAAVSCGDAAAGAGLSVLEVKLGLLAVAEVLTFLHGAARLVYCGLSPQTVVVAADGSWKLAGFAFAVPLDHPLGGSGSGGVPYRSSGGNASRSTPGRPPYDYGDPFPPLWEDLAKPQLPYTAPELVVPPGSVASGSPWGAAATCPATSSYSNPFLDPPPPPPLVCPWASADAFSLGALSYEVILAAEATEAAGGGASAAGKGTSTTAVQLLPVRCSVQQYSSRLAALATAAAAAGGGGRGGGGAVQGPLGLAGGGGADLSRLTPEVQALVLSLVSPSPSARPTPAALARCDWFEDDTRLRALRFLEGMVQSDLRDKLAFLADLGDESAGTAGSSTRGGGGDGGDMLPSVSISDTGGGGALWRRIPDRLLTNRVLPALMQEVRNGGPGGAAALPVALAVCRRLGRTAFAAIALPVLATVMEAAAPAAPVGTVAGGTAADDGAAMLPVLVGQSEMLAGLMDGPTLDRVLLPMLLRAILGPGLPAANAAASGAVRSKSPSPVPGSAWLPDPPLVLATLARLQALVVSGLLDCGAQQVRQRLVPALLTACSRTTSSGVRTACIGLLAAMAAKVDRSEAEAIVASCTQLLSVDTSGGTLMAVGSLSEALAGAPSWGPAAAAYRLLPLLSPHLLAPTLSPQQLAALAGSVQALLTRVVCCAEEAAMLRAGATAVGFLVGGVGGPPALTPPGYPRPAAATTLAGRTAAAGSNQSGGGSDSANGGAVPVTSRQPSPILAYTTWTRSRTTTAAASPSAVPATPAVPSVTSPADNPEVRPLQSLPPPPSAGAGSGWGSIPGGGGGSGSGAQQGGAAGRSGDSAWPSPPLPPAHPHPQPHSHSQSQSEPQAHRQAGTWLLAAPTAAAAPAVEPGLSASYQPPSECGAAGRGWVYGYAGAQGMAGTETYGGSGVLHGTRPGEGASSPDPFAALAPLSPSGELAGVALGAPDRAFPVAQGSFATVACSHGSRAGVLLAGAQPAAAGASGGGGTVCGGSAGGGGAGGEGKGGWEGLDEKGAWPGADQQPAVGTGPLKGGPLNLMDL